MFRCELDTAHALALVVLVFVAGLTAGAASAGCKKSEAAPDGRGRALFLTACARCHGPEGAGGLPLFDGGPSPRNFRDRAFHAERTDEQIRLTIVNGKGTGMPPFGPTFKDEELAALVAHVRSLDPGRTK